MPKIFVHALEGEPEDPINFTGKTERDIRVSWLVGNPPGTGPWTVKSRSPQGIILKRQGTPPTSQHLEEVHLVFIPDGADLAERLQHDRTKADYVDFAPTLTDPRTFPALRQRPDLSVVATGGYNVFYLSFCLNRPPFDNPKVGPDLRRAIAYAIDVRKYVPLGGGAAAAAIGPIPPDMRGHDPTLPQPSNDLVKAKRLLDGSGYDPTQPLTLLCGNTNTYSAMLAQAVANDLNTNLRLRVNLQPHQTWEKMLDAANAGPGHMFIYTWNQRHAYNDDPKQLLHALFHTQGKGNRNKYKNAVVDQELNSPSPNHRLVQQKVFDDVPMVCLSHWTRHAAYKADVKNLRLTHAGLPDDKLLDVTI
ncbi:MAG TPA: ABC transporter substrate-binding protein [Candidatus Methylomirabilis sp.]|nr:ABC transporter substrate-binding protein [Candidatus Methylomirabilis sp.]